MSQPLTATLVHNLRDLVRDAIRHTAPTPALVLADDASPLARLLAGAYREALPHAAFLPVGPAAPVLAAIDALPPGALVVLIESTRFDLGEFRFRLELFKRGLAVVEHPHVARIRDAELPIYVDALAYDPAYYRGLGEALKARIDAAATIRLHSPAGTLHYQGPFESARKNVGDYTGLATVGGQFPIGEVFTEPVDLDGVAGAVTIAAFGAHDYSVVFPEVPFTLTIAGGCVVSAPGAPAAFETILGEIAAKEGDIRVRELGFGLNRAMRFDRRVNDVGTFERMCGVHLSLGSKHAIYSKPGFNRRRTHFHLDVFCAADRVSVDDTTVYADEVWAR